MKFVKSNHRATLKWTLGRINSHSFKRHIVQVFDDYKTKQKLNSDNYCTLFHVKLAFLSCLCRHYKLFLGLAGVFGFLQMTVALNKFAQPWFILCVNKRE